MVSEADAGVLLARLHQYAVTVEPNTVPANLRSDRVVYFHEVNLLLDYRSDYGALFREAHDRAQTQIDALWKSPPHEPHLLHGDFGLNNVLTWRNQLRPIDFQDLQFGFDVQDLGITLADLARNAPELAEHFQSGYQSVRETGDLSPAMLASFRAARSLNMMNLGLHLRRAGIQAFLERHSRIVHEWMSSTTLPDHT